MAKEPDSGKRIKLNPLFSKLLEAGGENGITLTGFVAPAGREGYIRLFLGLNNMSKSIEIAESDIIATVDLPKSGLGAVAILVKPDGTLHHHHIESAQSFAARPPGAPLTNIRRGGLRMRARPVARDTCTCEYYCDGTHCVPCTSTCVTQTQ
jgi:hypothetical protein